MAGTIKGITIEFNGDTTKLGKALTEINRKAGDVDKALREVNRALKFNPGNTELIAQKQQLLKTKIQQTKEQLQAFERAQKDLDDRGVEKTSQEYMELRRKIIEADSKLQHFNAELRRLNYAKIEALGKSFQNAGRKMRTAGMYSTAAGAAMIMAGKKLLEYSTVQNQAETKLIEIYKTRMGATEAAARSTMKLASAIQKEGVIGDEVTLSGAQQLATFAKYPGTVDKILPAMDNLLAQQKGYSATADDAKNTANLLGKALQGQTGALSRVGISFTEAQAKILKTGNEEERAAVLAQVVTDNVGHMNAELAKTPEGKIQQAKNNIGDLAERLGNVLLPVLGKVAQYVNEQIIPKVEQFMQYLDAHPAIAKMVVSLTGILTIGGPILAMLGAMTSGIGSLFANMSKIVGVLGRLTGPFGLVIAGIAALAGVLVLAYQKSASFRNAVNGLVKSVGGALKPVMTTLVNVFKQLAPIVLRLVTVIGNALAPVIKALTPAITAIVRVVASIARTILPVLISVIRTIAPIIEDVVKTAAPIIELLAKIFSKVVRTILKVVGPVFKTVLKLISVPIKAALKVVKTVVNGIKKFFKFTGLGKTVSKIFNAVKDKIWTPIKKAKDKISGIINKIKKWFPIDVGKLITFTLPKIGKSYKKRKMKGGGSYGQYSFDVSQWQKHAEGGIFTRPTLLPDIGGNPHLVGDAGAEAILPLKELWAHMDKIGEGGKTVNANYYITIDGSKGSLEMARELVSALKTEMRTI